MHNLEDWTSSRMRAWEDILGCSKFNSKSTNRDDWILYVLILFLKRAQKKNIIVIVEKQSQKKIVLSTPVHSLDGDRISNEDR